MISFIYSLYTKLINMLETNNPLMTEKTPELVEAPQNQWKESPLVTLLRDEEGLIDWSKVSQSKYEGFVGINS